MRARTKYVVIALGIAAVALGAAALTITLTRDSSSPTAAATTDSVSPNYVGAPGSLQAEKPTRADLDNVRDQVTTWLVENGFDGYSVSEVMAFTNNDYIAVETPRGANAFELLAAPGAGWLMLEPPSMLWNTRFGMQARKNWESNWSGTGEMAPLMGGGRSAGEWGGWYASGTTKVQTPAKALEIANRWLAGAHPGEKAVSDARAFPGYFTIDTTVGGKPAGMLSVNQATGAIWYHGWHGGFLAERAY
jgi:hypothetical protein